MTVVRVPRAVRARTVTIRAPWTCQCGRQRLVLAANVRTDLPFDTGARQSGPCPACGRTDTYRITAHPRYFEVHVGEG